ncbi:MAG: hypothetical protein ACR2KY_03685, partial [Thermoleophilaceae bacterium]
ARAALEQALALEPGNFATLGLLGDLESRSGNPAAAGRQYRRAAELNPRDVGLEELARKARHDGRDQTELPDAFIDEPEPSSG